MHDRSLLPWPQERTGAFGFRRPLSLRAAANERLHLPAVDEPGGVAPSRFESKVDIREVVVHGDCASTRVDLEIEVAPTKDSKPVKLAGRTMSVCRKKPGGRWVWRDANMVAPVGR